MSARFITTLFILIDINYDYDVYRHGLSQLCLITPISILITVYASMVYHNFVYSNRHQL